MHLSAALQYSWEKGSVNAKQCVAPISMPGFRLLGLEPRSRFTIVRDLTQRGWRATRLRRGGGPQPAAGGNADALGLLTKKGNYHAPASVIRGGSTQTHISARQSVHTRIC